MGFDLVSISLMIIKPFRSVSDVQKSKLLPVQCFVVFIEDPTLSCELWVHS